MRPSASVVVDGSLFLTRGTLPPKSREKLGLAWTEADEVKLRRFARVVNLKYGLLPERARYIPRAYRGMVRARQGNGRSANAGSIAQHG